MVCLYEVAFGWVFRRVMKLGAGKATLMRGGACADELRLMGIRVRCIVFLVCWVFIYVLWGCAFLFNFIWAL